MNNITIRKATFSDIGHILEIEQENIRSWTQGQFTEELARNFSVFIVAETEGVIAGYAIAWIVADELQLNSIAVKNSLQGNGIGRMLLEGLEAESRNGAVCVILLEVRSRNTGAIDFYIKNGFIKTGRRKNYYGDDDAILMEKKI